MPSIRQYGLHSTAEEEEKMKSRSSDGSFFKKIAVRSNFKLISSGLIHIGLI